MRVLSAFASLTPQRDSALDEDACATAVAKSSSPGGQFNGAFHGQAGDQDGIVCQTRHSEIRLLATLTLSSLRN